MREGLRKLLHRHPGLVVLVPAVAVYALLATFAALRHGDQINPDGVSYIQLARHLVGGDVQASLSSWWSPLLSWLLAPWLALGADGLHAARVVLAVCGLAFVLASYAFVRRFTNLPRSWTLVVLLLVAIEAADWATRVITPDIIVAAALLLYFSIALDKGLLGRKRVPLLCGLVAGIAALAKAYALPFFLIHFPFTVVLTFLFQGEAARPWRGLGTLWDAATAKKLLTVTALGFLGVTLVVGPWIAALSWHYGQFAYSSAGAANHAWAGPLEAQIPVPEGLASPPAPHRSAWERPETTLTPHASWSPFQSAMSMNYQATHTLGTSRETIGYFADLLLWLTPLSIWFLIRMRAERFRILWVWGTLVLYCGGYALVLLTERRYVRPVLAPVLLATVYYLLFRLTDGFSWATDQRRRRQIAGLLLGGLLTLTLALVTVAPMARSLASHSATYYRLVANGLLQAGCQGPVASSSWHKGLYVSYHMKAVYLGGTVSEEAAGWTRELRDTEARTFLVWRRASQASATLAGWQYRFTMPAPDLDEDEPGVVDAYAREQPVPATARPGSEPGH
jgi:hypothetical protein